MGESYDVVTSTRDGEGRVHRYAADSPLEPGDVLRLAGRFWLISKIEPRANSQPSKASAAPARYRIRMRHTDGREETGAFRRFRTGAPRLGHAFTTVEDGAPVTWHVVAERLEKDERGEPYLDVLAERDYTEVESLPDHELEHALAEFDERVPPEAFARLVEAAVDGLAIELVALDPGEEPDWDEAERFIDTLVIDEIEDDLLELCGVNPDADPRESWLGTIKERLRSDLEHFRSDLAGDHAAIEVWEYLDGRIFASVGSWEDEADPDSGHGWMCRLVDSEALGAAGFARVRKTEL